MAEDEQMAAKRVRLRRAPGQPPHPATRRTGYCDIHHDDYQRARSAHTSRVAKARNAGQTLDDADWEQRIEFTNLEESWTVLSPDARHDLRQASLKLGTTAARLAPAAASVEAFFDVDAQQAVEDINALLDAVHETQRVIRALGQEPE